MSSSAGMTRAGGKGGFLAQMQANLAKNRQGSQRPGAPPSGRVPRGRGGRGGRGRPNLGSGFNPDGTRHTTYQDPNLTPHYQRFLQQYGKQQPGPASEDPYYQRNPEYEQKQPDYGPPEGGWNPEQKDQWRTMSPEAQQASQTAHRQQADQAVAFQGGRFQPGPWRGPGEMPAHLAGRRANPIPQSIFQRPYDQRPAPMAPPQGYGPGQTPGSGKLNQQGRGGGGYRFQPTQPQPMPSRSGYTGMFGR